MEPGEIFISYSRQDAAYVERLIAHLRAAGLAVWRDDQIPDGERWDHMLRAKIDGCAAFVLVMSTDADNSAWVGEEIDRARAKGRPILPLLLSGEVFFGFSRTQFEDVRGGQLPDAGFVERLRTLTAAGPAPGAVGPATTEPSPDAAVAAGTPPSGEPVCVSVVDGHTDAVTTVAYSPRGTALATGSRDHTVRTWPASGYGPVARLTRHTGVVWTVAFSADGQHLISAGADGLVCVWRRGDGALSAALTGHTDGVRSVSCHPTRPVIASGSEDATVRIWSNNAVESLTDTDGRAFAVAYSPDGTQLAVGGDDGAHLRDADTGQRLQRLRADDFLATSLAWSPDGTQLAVGGDDGQVRMYDRKRRPHPDHPVPLRPRLRGGLRPRRTALRHRRADGGRPDLAGPHRRTGAHPDRPLGPGLRRRVRTGRTQSGHRERGQDHPGLEHPGLSLVSAWISARAARQPASSTRTRPITAGSVCTTVMRRLTVSPP